ncbi:MAG: DUF2523 family protein [Pseudomonadota bacterium]
MPIFAFLGSLISGLASTVIGWIGAAMPMIAGYLGATAVQLGVSVGFGIATFTGVDLAIDYMMDAAVSAVGDIPARGVQMLGYLWVDKAFNLIFSSGTALLTLKGIRGGVATRQVWTKPNVTQNSIGERLGGFGA